MLQSTMRPAGPGALSEPKKGAIPRGWSAAPRTVLKEDGGWMISGRWRRAAEADKKKPPRLGGGAGAGAREGAPAQGRNSQCQASEGTVRTKPKLLAWAASHR